MAAEFIVGDKPRWETSVDLCLKTTASSWKQHRVGCQFWNFSPLLLLVMGGALVVPSFFAGNVWVRHFPFFERECGGDPHSKEI
jgi:hypothetical protein